MSIFRKEALEARQAREDGATLTVAPPWTGTLFIGIGVLLLGFITWSIFGRVPVTERGRGILQPVGGPRPLVSTVAGRVLTIPVKNGQAVKAGDTILEIEAPSVAAPALLAERDKAMAGVDLGRLAVEEDRIYREQKRRVGERLRSAHEQLASLDKSMEMQARKVVASERLVKDQLLSAIQADEAREGLETLRRQRQQAKQAIVSLNQESATLEAQNADRALQRKRDLERVDAAAAGQALAQAQTVVVAAVDGVVEGLQVHRGDSVQIGDELGRVMPIGAPLEVVAYLSEKHQAFAREGGIAFVEIDQLPYGEFGSAKARIKRIARGTATSRELQATLGAQASPADGPMVRVELELLDGEPARKAGVALQPGMRAKVRFMVRKQSLFSLMVAPFRRWLD